MAIKAKQNEAGFTLVEILWVLAVLGLTAGLIVLNLPQGDDPFDDRIQTFAAQFNIIQQDSYIDGKTRGLEINTDGFELLQYSEDWSNVTEQSWGDVFNVKLTVEDEIIDFTNRQKILDDAEDIILPPLIQFNPLEGVTAFELDIQTQSKTYRLSPDIRGKITVGFVQ